MQVLLAALGDEQLAAQERREGRHRVEGPRRPLDADDLGLAAPRAEQLDRSGSAGSGTRSSPWTSGQNGSATDAGLRSVSIATHGRGSPPPSRRGTGRSPRCRSRRGRSARRRPPAASPSALERRRATRRRRRGGSAIPCSSMPVRSALRIPADGSTAMTSRDASASGSAYRPAPAPMSSQVLVARRARAARRAPARRSAAGRRRTATRPARRSRGVWASRNRSACSRFARTRWAQAASRRSADAALLRRPSRVTIRPRARRRSAAVSTSGLAPSTATSSDEVRVRGQQRAEAAVAGEPVGERASRLGGARTGFGAPSVARSGAR